MDFHKAITLSLGELEAPVITRYQLGVMVHDLNATGVRQGEKIDDLKKSVVDVSAFNARVKALEDSGILRPFPGFGTGVYSLLGRKSVDADEAACSIDPFCYVSHLSAMAHHGLTNRIPTKVFLSSPDPKSWKTFAAERMQKDLGAGMEAYLKNGMPPLTRLNFTKIGRREVNRFSSSHLGAYKLVRGKTLRVSSLGRTFLEMLRNPELCGGMRHVIEVYEEHGAQYRQLILNEIDLHGAPIDKVRAGYILQEKLGLEDTVIEGWVKFAQRGGSRKLDATGEYLPQWSEKWCLSLNL